MDKIERSICGDKMNDSQKTLETRVWTLALNYSTALENLEYSKFLDLRPALAVQRVVNRINHPQLRRRTSTHYRMSEDDYCSDLVIFLMGLVKEETHVGKNESSTATARQVRDDKPPSASRRNVDKSKESERAKGLRDEVIHGLKRRVPTGLNLKCGY